MTDSVKVDAATITVAKPFPRAPQPGDQLLVIDGVCLGFYQNGPQAPSAARKKPGRPAKLGGPAKQPDGKIHGRHQPEEDEKVLAVLREHGPLDARRLLDGLGADPRTERRRLFGSRIARLVRRGVLRPVRGEKNKQQPRYEIAG